MTLAKGGNVSLDKEAPGLSQVLVALGWEERATSGEEHDLDASAVLVGKDGKVPDDAHSVFYNNLRSPDGSVEHTGDNLTGSQAGTQRWSGSTSWLCPRR